jgi:2-octaprenylphenol hydroxylase|tara:strand:+ start:1383 stop:2675 length:1293 start_codon:yes stop_codon:yes gene_type:complete
VKALVLVISSGFAYNRIMKSTPQIDVDIAIVGAGLVGATFAHLLAPLPLNVALIDQREFGPLKAPFDSSELEFDPRVSALTEASKLLFQKLGVWEAITDKRASPYHEMEVWDADGTGAIDFSAREIGSSELGHIVENSLILSALHDSLASIENLELVGGVAIEQLILGNDNGDKARITTESGTVISASLVVAADGGNSFIRKLANIDTKEWDYEHTAIVTTVKTQLPHGAKALQRFMSSGPLAFLPLSLGQNSADQHYCSIVWSCLPELAESLMALPNADFNESLEQAIESRLGKIEFSAKRFAVPLRQRHGKKYYQNNVVLVGDAAHTIHPLAGQGVNLGLLDVAALAEELRQGLKNGRSVFDPVVLGRYERKRRGHNLTTMWAMEGFKRLFAEETLPVRWLRNVGLKSVNSLPLLKNQIVRKAMGLDS